MRESLHGRRRSIAIDELVRQSASRKITRRQFCERALGLGLSASAAGALLAACGAAAKKTPVFTPSPMSTALPKKLDFWNWPDYMAPGIKQGFKQKYGVEVVEHSIEYGGAFTDVFYDNNVHFDVDLLVLPDYLVHILGRKGRLVPLDLQYIPNATQVIPKLAHPPFDTWPDGRRYSVPYQWVVTGIGVRREEIQAPITGWADLWNPQYRGQIQMLNDEREDLGAALKKNGFSLNTQVQNELDKATSDLIAQKPLVLGYDSIDPKRAMVRGAGLVHCWSSDVVLARWSGLGPAEKLDFVLPEEGYGIWVDNMCIPKGAASPYAAHLFINYLCDPAVNAKLTNWTGSFSPITSAAPLLDKRIAALVPSVPDLERGEIFNDVGAFAQNYAAAWQSVKGA
jgi:spermidine/putrescine transport system substrate-binding protein